MSDVSKNNKPILLMTSFVKWLISLRYHIFFWTVAVCIAGDIFALLKYKDYFPDIMRLSILIISVEGIMFGLLQLSANHDWNRRSLTATKLQEYTDKLRDIRLELDELTKDNERVTVKGKNATFTDRYYFFATDSTSGKGLTSNEVHEWIAEFSNDEMVLMEDEKKNKTIKMHDDGAKIVHNIFKIINIYEGVAINLKYKVFDWDIVEDYMKNAIIKNFEFFRDYIIHQREEHGSEKFAVVFEELYKVYKGEKDRFNQEKASDGS